MKTKTDTQPAGSVPALVSGAWLEVLYFGCLGQVGHYLHTKSSRSLRSESTPPLNAVVGGSLNPSWVEWLMNWPLGWTDLTLLPKKDFNDWFSKNSCAENNSTQSWWEEEPINVPRTSHNIPARVDRLRCLGNGQVPAVTGLAWNLLR